ncbi:MAG TPA: DUF2934 domain-containing protein [Amaricoccus sp.]|uniref:DUF2934 domain-containing protein n=1 Tax=Amaricoccus sp. TaxID=1872485 RepID=UPI002C96C97F|nr:DUF2934 domain-containing protein [Amaricoccus sp.]HPG22859.1 DUF2934 domain-containing protein [Amaricoccus sp.]HRW16124.1 DUF2934 domain-containing protein [Amaricoccus sp.]
MITELEHRIRERAHMIWEREGRPADRAEAHWMTASAEIAAEAAPAAKPKPRRKVAAAKTEAAPSVAAEAPKRRRAKPKAAKAD